MKHKSFNAEGLRSGLAGAGTGGSWQSSSGKGKTRSVDFVTGVWLGSAVVCSEVTWTRHEVALLSWLLSGCVPLLVVCTKDVTVG